MYSGFSDNAFYERSFCFLYDPHIQYIEVKNVYKIVLNSRVKGLETNHVHTFALYIELQTVNVAPFNTSQYNFPGYTAARREVVQRLEPLSSRQKVKKRS